MEEFITMQEAADLAGYRDTSTLHRAARTGKLTTITRGPHARLTTRAWLDAYLGNVKPRGIARGKGGDDQPQ